VSHKPFYEDSTFKVVDTREDKDAGGHRSGRNESPGQRRDDLLSVPGTLPGTTCNMRETRLSKPQLSARPISKDGHVSVTQACAGRDNL
jgi:hypothetical protein